MFNPVFHLLTFLVVHHVKFVGVVGWHHVAWYVNTAGSRDWACEARSLGCVPHASSGWRW